MKLSTSTFSLSLLWASQLVLSAVDINGNQVVGPISDDDPAPISDSQTYYPEQNDCPLACNDLSNVNGWTRYFSIDRLQRCQEPMLLKFSVSQLLDDPSTTVLIRSCTWASPSVAIAGNMTGIPAEVENPKMADDLFRPALKTALACLSKGVEVSSRVNISSNGSGGIMNRYSGDVSKLLQAFQAFFGEGDNCDENFVFARHQQTVAGMYIGAGLGKPTVGSVIKAVGSTMSYDRTIAQLCDDDRSADQVFGLSVDRTGDLVGVQKTLRAWSQSTCAKNGDQGSSSGMADVKIFQVLSNSTASASLSGETSSGISGKSPSSTSSKLSTSFILSASGNANNTSSGITLGASTATFSRSSASSTTSSRMMRMMQRNIEQRLQKRVPKPGSDGTCATHLIADNDSCDSLARQYGLTVDAIEKFNKGKTWAWTECKAMLAGYNMCLSNGTPPLPPPQQGAECGPVVPGTTWTNKSVPLTDLNPCPLKACCSNWGFCGPFPAHCDIHAPAGGGPGAKLAGYESTCIANCGNQIKQNSGPPASFSRIGYYESWNLGRDCLWLNAKDANTDGTYTHIHWGFVNIDASSWTPVVNDTFKQWEDFKKLSNVKRVISFGGWAYSTEPATYNIIRRAIIDNRETFATNVASFIQSEGLDGVDIDWEYPGAPDIYVNGQPIGQKTDGVNYLRFLTTLKQKLGSAKSVSIAAPASYWYLKAFPIDRIAEVIDYIVYMTYDLHGQWDYGNVNAFDACPSGKCIRSHVNLTETRNSLSIITKAGVPNNKIFVGESSYGRSFHMAVDGCWGPMCEFTGSKTQSDAVPGRCTKTSGYVSNAEINDIIRSGDGATSKHDAASNSDILLYKGDYVSYMTPTTKDTRRADWKTLNFAGSIDWAVDLQAFGSADFNAPPGNAGSGQGGCIFGVDNTLNTGDLCEFACSYDFCPEPLCTCEIRDTIPALPGDANQADFFAWDRLDVDLNRLCKFTCKYGYCPPEICYTPVVDKYEDGYSEFVGEPGDAGYFDERVEADRLKTCNIYQDPDMGHKMIAQCLRPCEDTLNAARAEGRTSNYGCVGFWPLDKPIPWQKVPGYGYSIATGKCFCDNYFVNTIADFIIEALPIIAEIGCYVLMSSLKLILDLGTEFLGGAGRTLDAGMDMAANAAQIIAWAYPKDQDPEGAFSWWLSPCGGTDLVPDDIKNLFDILTSFSDGLGSFHPPKNLPKGSGRKGDSGNPNDQSKPKAGTGTGSNGTGGRGTSKKKCEVPVALSTKRVGALSNTLQKMSCVNDKTKTEQSVVTSFDYEANAQVTNVAKLCSAKNTQACYHYSSANRVNPQWGGLDCPDEARTTNRPRLNAKATAVWSQQHAGSGWQNPQWRQEKNCDRDEWPPAYFLSPNNVAYINSGTDSKGQLVRWIPKKENAAAGQEWRGFCFKTPMQDLTDARFENKLTSGRKTPQSGGTDLTIDHFEISVDVKPRFSFGTWDHAANPLPNDGLNDNPCWPKLKAPKDPGFCLLTYDPFYNGAAPPYDYRAAV